MQLGNPQDAPHVDNHELVTSFEEASIGPQAWNHETHLRCAFGLLRRYGAHDGLIRMRTGIFALNAAHGRSNTTTSGYHETITVVWFTLLAAAVRDTAASDFDQLVGQRPDLLDGTAMARHYSPERLASVEARARYIRPDRELLPAL